MCVERPPIVAPACPVDAQDVVVVRKPFCDSDGMLVCVRRKGPGGLVHETDAKCLERLGGWIR